MMRLFFIICAIHTPDLCERHEVPVEGTELQCMSRAQAVLVDYVRDGWVVKRWGCER